MKTGINRDIVVTIDDIVFFNKLPKFEFDYGFAIGIARNANEEDALLVHFPNGIVNQVPLDDIIGVTTYEEFINGCK